jgi:uncharacterized membrane protein YuzA (DUF378 family)
MNFTFTKSIVRHSEYTTTGNHAGAGTKELEMRQMDALATVLLVVGALNWGLVGVARFDLVAALFGMQFGETSALTSVIYGLVGLAGVYRAITFNGVQRQTAPLATR